MIDITDRYELGLACDSDVAIGEKIRMFKDNVWASVCIPKQKGIIVGISANNKNSPYTSKQIMFVDANDIKVAELAPYNELAWNEYSYFELKFPSNAVKAYANSAAYKNSAGVPFPPKVFKIVS